MYPNIGLCTHVKHEPIRSINSLLVHRVRIHQLLLQVSLARQKTGKAMTTRNPLMKSHYHGLWGFEQFAQWIESQVAGGVCLTSYSNNADCLKAFLHSGMPFSLSHFFGFAPTAMWTPFEFGHSSDVSIL